ncbi:MAG: F0F1 ATP synthase subunit alpha, partial [Mycoplasma sp.]
MAHEKFASIIKENIKKYSNQIITAEDGKVLSVGDGIVIANGLNNVMLNEVVEFENGTEGLVLNLEEDSVAIICMGEYENIRENSMVKRTNKVSHIKVGDGYLGRIIDALGNPIDGLGPIKSTEESELEKIAPGVMTRKSVDQPLETGILTIDSMFPIGKGQRELIIGDRQTGKTTIAIDAIINQNGKDVYCVYVAIGQKASSVSNVVRTLEEHDALKYTSIICSPADDLPALNYLAPFTGITIAEYWMSKGKDVLIIYDDLSKHAVAYRTLSLLLKRPPGREAYPGDVFYLHSRLLERACRVNSDNGGGSITALPIIETQAGDISAYIPTNVISITDGQLFMQSDLFNSGQRPAIDPGLSVSRVGSSAQIKCMKQAASSLKLELASYFELQAFSQFGSDIDNDTKIALHHGERILAMIKQKQSHPINQIDETLYLFAIKERFIDFVPLNKISDFKEKILFSLATTKTCQMLTKKKEITKDIEIGLRAEFKKFIKSYIKSIPDYSYPIGFDENDLKLSAQEQA